VYIICQLSNKASYLKREVDTSLKSVYLQVSEMVQGEIPNIRLMFNDIEHSSWIDFDIYIFMYFRFFS
jgi:hypothetical protein